MINLCNTRYKKASSCKMLPYKCSCNVHNYLSSIQVQLLEIRKKKVKLKVLPGKTSKSTFQSYPLFQAINFAIFFRCFL